MATYAITSAGTTINFGEPVEVRNTGSVSWFWRDATRGTQAAFRGDADSLRLIARGPVRPGETVSLPRIVQIVAPTGGRSGEMMEPAGTEGAFAGRSYNMSEQLSAGIWVRQSVDDGAGDQEAAADSHWLVYLLSPTLPTRGVVLEMRVPSDAAETMHPLYQVREGEIRPAAHIDREDWTVDGGVYTAANDMHYYNLGAEGDYVEFDVPASANGYDVLQLEVYSVDATSGTVDVTVDGDSVGTIATDIGSTTTWARVSLTLDTPLATGETVRLTRTASPANSARIGEIMLMDSDGTPSVGDEVDVVGSGEAVTKPGSATELAIKAQPDGEGTATYFGSYGHQGGDYLTQTSVTESVNIGVPAWTPAYGWSAGQHVRIARDSTIYFDADDNLGSLYEWYTFDGAQMTYRWMFEASQALNLAASSYAAMWPWDDAVTRLDVADDRISLDDDLADNDYVTLPAGAIKGVFGDRSDTRQHIVTLLAPTGAVPKKTWLLYLAGEAAKVYHEIEVDSTFASGRIIGGGLNYAVE
jgi:hypothetical protein